MAEVDHYKDAHACANVHVHAPIAISVRTWDGMVLLLYRANLFWQISGTHWPCPRYTHSTPIYISHLLWLWLTWTNKSTVLEATWDNIIVLMSLISDNSGADAGYCEGGFVRESVWKSFVDHAHIWVGHAPFLSHLPLNHAATRKMTKEPVSFLIVAVINKAKIPNSLIMSRFTQFFPLEGTYVPVLLLEVGLGLAGFEWTI